jgi:biopolymer transport protein ExbD
MAGGGNMESGEPDFQIAPMIDVLLVMLIFFMTITSAQVLRVDKNIKLPSAPDAQRKENGRAEAIINVRWEAARNQAVFTFDDRPYEAADQFVNALALSREVGEKQGTESANPHFRVVIRADREVPARYVAQAMNAAGQAGISDISFSSVNHE